MKNSGDRDPRLSRRTMKKKTRRREFDIWTLGLCQSLKRRESLTPLLWEEPGWVVQSQKEAEKSRMKWEIDSLGPCEKT